MLWYKYMIYILLLFLISDSYSLKEDEELLKNENFNKTWVYMSNDEGDIYKAVIVQSPQQRTFSQAADGMKYTLHTRKYPAGEILTTDEPALETSSFNVLVPTKIVTHGWRSSGNKSACQNIKDAYMEEGNYNVIIMDWEPMASNINYVSSVLYVEPIGRELAKFVDSLICQGANPKDIHMIGHSLGAHIMGEAGRNLREERIYRITGLDPAGPLFNIGFQRGLTSDSADFVDVIHTAAGSLGIPRPSGTVDFYPNGGKLQPTCIKFFMPDIACDHAASWKYFASSIQDKHKYAAVKCPSFAHFQKQNCEKEFTYMGDAVSTNVAGIYFLEVKDKF